jgi:hypothetical protein
MIFEYFKLNWIDYVQIDESLLRPSDIGKGFANASKAKQKIDWEANLKGDKLIEKLIIKIHFATNKSCNIKFLNVIFNLIYGSNAGC